MTAAEPSRPVRLVSWLARLTALFILSALAAVLLARASNLGQSWRVFVTIVLSIVTEAFPFLILGSMAAALIHRFVSTETLSFIPASGAWRYLVAGLAGLAFPVCECAIVPIMHSLVKKGAPASVAVTFMAAAPVVNPLVGLSTWIAFNGAWQMVAARLGLSFTVAVLAGLLLGYLGVDRQNVLRSGGSFAGPSCEHGTHEGFFGFFDIMAEELSQTGGFLVLGAVLAALFQVGIPRTVMAGLSQNPLLGTGSMMSFAYLSSLCSEADAFVAAAFRGIFPTGALLGFLVLGPMMDVKNTLLLLSGYKRPFVGKVVGVLVLLTLGACVGFSLLG